MFMQLKPFTDVLKFLSLPNRVAMEDEDQRLTNRMLASIQTSETLFYRINELDLTRLSWHVHFFKNCYYNEGFRLIFRYQGKPRSPLSNYAVFEG